MSGAFPWLVAGFVLVAMTYSLFAGSADFDGAAQAKALAPQALEQFLPSIESSRTRFGFKPNDNLHDLQIEAPIPATTFNLDKLAGGQNLDDAGPFLNPVEFAWFPVSLNGHICGILSLVKPKNGNGWMREAFGQQQVAQAIEPFLKKYSSPKYSLEAVYAPQSGDVMVVVNGLSYNNLTFLPADAKSAEALADQPRPASVVLASIRARLSNAPLHTTQ